MWFHRREKHLSQLKLQNVHMVLLWSPDKRLADGMHQRCTILDSIKKNVYKCVCMAFIGLGTESNVKGERLHVDILYYLWWTFMIESGLILLRCLCMCFQNGYKQLKKNVVPEHSMATDTLCQVQRITASRLVVCCGDDGTHHAKDMTLSLEHMHEWNF